MFRKGKKSTEPGMVPSRTISPTDKPKMKIKAHPRLNMQNISSVKQELRSDMATHKNLLAKLGKII